MAKAKAREYVWLECTDCGALNYRVQVRAQGGAGGKLAIKKYCPQTRSHTEHKASKKK